MRGSPDPEPHDLEGYAKRERRMAKKLLIFGGGFIGLIVLGVLYWNWSAAREWQRLKADLEAKGETFDLQRLLPPAPPEDKNFGAMPPLKDIALVLDSDSDKGEPAARRAAFPRISLQINAYNRDKLSLQSGVERGVPANLTMVADEHRSIGALKMPVSSGNAAGDLLAGIKATAPVLALLCEPSNQPESQFTPALASRHWATPSISQKVPHFDAVQNASRLLQLQAIAAAHANEGRVATDSLIAMTNLAKGMAQEPGLVAHLDFLTITSMTHAALWEGLNRRVFSIDQLADLQASLKDYDGREALLYALRTEMLGRVEAVYDLKTTRWKSGFDGINGEPTIIVRMVPDGWFDQNARHLVFHEWTYMIEPLKTGCLRSAVIKADSLNTLQMAADPPRIAFLVSDLLLGSEHTAIERAALEQSRRDLGSVAVALERFFALHRAYPENLSELVPSILTSPPLDRTSGKSVQYHRTEDGRYMIWAPGFDGSDDGGRVSIDPKTGDLPSSIRRSDYKGDWVWQYTPVKP